MWRVREAFLFLTFRHLLRIIRYIPISNSNRVSLIKCGLSAQIAQT